MKAVCDACGARYTLPEEQLRNRHLTLQCRRCGHVFAVRTMTQEAADAEEIVRRSQRATGVFKALGDGEDLDDLLSEMDAQLAAAEAAASDEATARPGAGSQGPASRGSAGHGPAGHGPAGHGPASRGPVSRSSLSSATASAAAAQRARRSGSSPVAGAGAAARTGPAAKGPGTAAAGAADSGIQWYFAINGESFGPYSEQELVHRFRTGRLGDEAWVWHAGMSGWVPSSQEAIFASALEQGRARRGDGGATMAASAVDGPEGSGRFTVEVRRPGATITERAAKGRQLITDDVDDALDSVFGDGGVGVGKGGLRPGGAGGKDEAATRSASAAAVRSTAPRITPSSREDRDGSGAAAAGTTGTAAGAPVRTAGAGATGSAAGSRIPRPGAKPGVQADEKPGAAVPGATTARPAARPAAGTTPGAAAAGARATTTRSAPVAGTSRSGAAATGAAATGAAAAGTGAASTTATGTGRPATTTGAAPALATSSSLSERLERIRQRTAAVKAVTPPPEAATTTDDAPADASRDTGDDHETGSTERLTRSALLEALADDATRGSGPGRDASASDASASDASVSDDGDEAGTTEPHGLSGRADAAPARRDARQDDARQDDAGQGEQRGDHETAASTDADDDYDVDDLLAFDPTTETQSLPAAVREASIARASAATTSGPETAALAPVGRNPWQRLDERQRVIVGAAAALVLLFLIMLIARGGGSGEVEQVQVAEADEPEALTPEQQRRYRETVRLATASASRQVGIALDAAATAAFQEAEARAETRRRRSSSSNGGGGSRPRSGSASDPFADDPIRQQLAGAGPAPSSLSRSSAGSSGPPASHFAPTLSGAVQQSVARCVTRHRAATGDVSFARVELTLTVEPSGSVSRVSVPRNLRDSPFANCLESQKGRWGFPSYHGEPTQLVRTYIVQ